MRFLSLFTIAAFALCLTGCGAEEVTTNTSQIAKNLVPNEYYGSYTGRRVDNAETATAASIENLIGSATLTLHKGATTFHMLHDGLVFGGSYTYSIVEQTYILELEIDQIEGYPTSQIVDGSVDLSANAESGTEPATPEMLERYEDIAMNISWKFEVVNDGFKQLESKKGPGMYEFTRDDNRPPIGEEEQS